MVGLILFYLALAALSLTGWVMNLMAIFKGLEGAINTLFIARLVGVPLVPFGALLGWFA